MSIEPSGQVFDEYARYYDLLYRDKAYRTETEFVWEKVSRVGSHPLSILELGCGTGRHAVEFMALGADVVGVDLSHEMVARAQDRQRGSGKNSNFHVGDVKTFRAGRQFDAVVSLFHVASYQASFEELDAMFATASAHLSSNGAFFFDFWYGPAVLTDPPLVRVKRLEDDSIQVTRIAEPEMNLDLSQVAVNYEVFIKCIENGAYRVLRERHLLRYWFLPELRALLQKNGLQYVESGGCYGNAKLSSATWFGWICARKSHG